LLRRRIRRRHRHRPAHQTPLLQAPPSSYSAAASELHRRLQFETDRASVRRWALEHQLAPDTRYKASPKPVKRWQARELGALWQYDASPHAWLPGNPAKQALLDLPSTMPPDRLKFAGCIVKRNSAAFTPLLYDHVRPSTYCLR